jgi:hypothetical protein
MGDAAWKRANEFEADKCPKRGCPGKLASLYHLTVSAPYDWRAVGFNKSTMKSSRIGIVACAWEDATPFCPTCGWTPKGRPESHKTEIIMRLMRELMMRGMSPGDIQALVGGNVRPIDVMAATIPEPE